MTATYVSDQARGAQQPAIVPGPSQELIDQSCRGPLLFMFVSAAAWLVFAFLFALIGAIKLHAPGFLADSAWLTYGRVWPAQYNAFLYGFASQAALGVTLWLLARLGRALLTQPIFVFLAAIFWNLGTAFGVIAILAGYSTGFERFEMPRIAVAALFFAYLLIAVAALFTFRARVERTLYVSVWFLLAAIFWFPWIYTTAAFLLLVVQPRGTVQPILNLWIANNLINLWLAPVALAVIFYFVPKLTRRPLYSFGLAAFSFWIFVLFAPWGGFLNVAAVPRWLISTSVVISVWMLIPLMSNAVNWHLTLSGSYQLRKDDFVLRFVLFAAAAYVAGGILTGITAFRPFFAVLGFTHFNTALLQLGLYGFIGMALMGAMFYIVPRLTASDWSSSRLQGFTYWGMAVGIVIGVAALAFGGIRQGIALNDPATPFIQTVRGTLPFIGLSTIATLLLLGAAASFLMNLIATVSRTCCAGCVPAFLVDDPAPRGGKRR